MTAMRPASARVALPALLGQWGVGFLLVMIAGLLLAWQPEMPRWSFPGSVRVAAAATLTLVWLAAWFLGSARRRRRLRSETTEAVQRRASIAPAAKRRILVAFASQTGFAEQLAARTAQALRAAEFTVDLRALADVDAVTLAAHDRALFVASTTGEGDAPDAAAGFLRDMLDARVDLAHLHFGVLALGDSDYANFCAFGHRLEDWLRESGACAMFDRVEVDNGDDGALRHWQHHLGQIAGRNDLPDWQPPDYARWRLVDRRLVNHGSAGGPCFHLVLQPVDGGVGDWSAGDIAEIGPCNAPSRVDAWLAALARDRGPRPDADEAALAATAARSVLPAVQDVLGFPARLLVDRLKPLPHREYSIASLPADGAIELLVRQMRAADGTLGIGSGWLTEHAPLGAGIALRVRRNANFHAPADARPLILIGNGTGMAGLRALLRERIAAGHRRNWLLFGERNIAHDFYWRDEIEQAHASGDIERLDLAFSRDQAERIHVQDRLALHADALRAWIDDGASIMVCGSLDGMAPGVDRVLRTILGDARVEVLLSEARYRRDVY